MYRAPPRHPEQTPPPGPGQLRAGAHTDHGALTILLPENVPGGLQAQNRRGDFVDVEAPPGNFVCNLGDLMQRWTNDRWRSTVHRVANPPLDHSAGNRRVSIAYFHQPNYDAVIECLPTCTGSGNPPRYSPVTSSEHRLKKYLARAPSRPRADCCPVRRAALPRVWGSAPRDHSDLSRPAFWYPCCSASLGVTRLDFGERSGRDARGRARDARGRA